MLWVAYQTITIIERRECEEERLSFQDVRARRSCGFLFRDDDRLASSFVFSAFVFFFFNDASQKKKKKKEKKNVVVLLKRPRRRRRRLLDDVLSFE